ncbi:MAG TPA: transmembrane anchor protein, partial [Orrella sp.]
MYNTNMPSRADLPSSGQLLRSTILALIAAIVILVTIVLPSEYGIDPTGIGQKLGLVEMGNIKTQLAAEAQADAQAKQQVATATTPAASGKVTAPAPASTSTAAAPAPA